MTLDSPLPFKVGTHVFYDSRVFSTGIIKAYTCDHKKAFLEIIENFKKRIIQVYVSQLFLPETEEARNEC